MIYILVFLILSCSGINTQKSFCQQNYNCDPNSLFRTFDGTCNNLQKPWLGSINTPYKRLLPSLYDDGNNTVRMKCQSKGILPNPRGLALSIHFPVEKEGPLSHLGVLFGQLITHDLTNSDKAKKADGSPLNCLAEDRNDPNCLTIPIPTDDSLNQDQNGFITSRTGATFINWNCEPSCREQINTLTHWLDLSVIYGNNRETAENLRLKVNGLFKTFRAPGIWREYMAQAPKGSCFVESEAQPCFLSGEDRPNENLILASVQTIWVREHNRIASIVKVLQPLWDDERIFQETRRIVIAEYQHVIYREWLPLIVSQSYVDKYKLSSNEYVYDHAVVPQLYNEFATAAFRFGHGMTKSSATKANANFQILKNMTLKGLTLDSTEAYNTEGLDAICRGALNERSSLNDEHVTDTLNNRLFEVSITKTLTFRSSLPALNINRGRDHGLNTYNNYRKYCNLQYAKDFSDLCDTIKPEIIERLKKVYATVDDIDLFTGGLSETAVPGGVVGPTFACIISRQFADLKFGDRHFYLNQQNGKDKLASIVRNIRFSGILCGNLQLNKIQRNAFLPSNESNRLTSCFMNPSLTLNSIREILSSRVNERPGLVPDFFLKKWGQNRIQKRLKKK